MIHIYTRNRHRGNINITQTDSSKRRWRTGKPQILGSKTSDFTILKTSWTVFCKICTRHTRNFTAWVVKDKASLIMGEKTEKRQRIKKNLLPKHMPVSQLKITIRNYSKQGNESPCNKSLADQWIKRARPGSQGMKDQLAINKTITTDNKIWRTNPSNGLNWLLKSPWPFDIHGCFR